MNDKEIKRRCIGCYQLKNRDEMFRLLVEYSSKVIINEPKADDFGRSIYICKNLHCINNAFKKNKINKFAKINISKEQQLQLINRLKKNNCT